MFDCATTKAVVGDNGIIIGVDFGLSVAVARISDTRDIGGISVEGNFYLSNLDLGFKFPLAKFMIEVLVDYDIVPS